MADNMEQSLEASPEQLLYAGILEKGMYLGLAILLITYILYVFGFISPFIPLNEVPNYWTLNVDEYLQKADIHAGWAWLGMLKYGDFLNFVGIAILALVTIVCYLSIIPGLLRSGDKVYALLALVEAIVLCVAASGILGSGGH